MLGGFCFFLQCLDLMYQVRAVPAPNAKQLGCQRYAWATIGLMVRETRPPLFPRSLFNCT